HLRVARRRGGAPAPAPPAGRGRRPAEIDTLGFAAAIHDVGMTRGLDHVLHAPRPLRDEEREAVAQHPELGAEIIRPLEDMSVVRDLILSHHERWDGTGYPQGLTGEAIPLGSRVLAAVDAYESMTAGRPYRPARRRDEAVAELRREAGHQFDPRVVDALLRAREREGGLA